MKRVTLQYVRQLETMLEVSKALGSEITLDNLLSLILDKTTFVMDAERSSLFLYDAKTNELWSKIAQGLKTKEIRIPLGVGIAGSSALTRSVINISDAYSDPRFNFEIDKITNFKTKNVLCMPLVGKEGQLIGVIQVLNKKRDTPFNKEDEDLLATLASHISVALHRANLMEYYIENKCMEESLLFARKIQMGMIPAVYPPFPDKADLIDIHAMVEPAKEVGGDLYDYFLLDDRFLCFIIGDVSGKGVPAAMFMAMTKTLFKAIAKSSMHPEDIVSAVNKLLVASNEAIMFVTLFCGMLDLTTGILEYCNAGHNPPYIIHPDGTVLNLVAAVPSIAMAVDEQALYHREHIQFNKGDTIYLYTDGVNEAMNQQHEQFSNESLQAFLAVHSSATAKELVLETYKEVKRFVKDAPQSDDIAMLVIKYL